MDLGYNEETATLEFKLVLVLWGIKYGWRTMTIRCCLLVFPSRNS